MMLADNEDLPSVRKELAVAAIDFGTTYSGCAYSFRADYLKDPLKIHTFHWSSDEVETEKTPTCILFDKDKNFHSFGYDAETYYAELAETNEHQGWRYFKHFKMMLMQKKQRQRLKRNFTLKDDQGNKMLAMDVFAASIKYLKSRLLSHIQAAVIGFGSTDLLWVLTVPAIWEDSSKQFMREAAAEAEIDNDKLIIAFEPEVAAILCKEITVKRIEDKKKSPSLSAFQPGAEFILLDLGGGTIDITVAKVGENGTLKHIHPPKGGPWGGTLVDEEFQKFLAYLFGETTMQSLSEKYKSDELFIYRSFEMIKRKIDRCSSKNRILRLPASITDCVGGVVALRRRIEQNSDNDKVILKAKDKLQIDDSIFIDMFNCSSRNIIRQTETLLCSYNEIKNIEALILVGGFSESAVIANDMKNKFHDKEIIIPEEPNLAILKGAVIYGQNSASIISRKMAYTYGISTAVPFDNQKHYEALKVIRNGIAKCESVFEKFFEIGQTVIPNETRVVRQFNPHSDFAKKTSVEIYRASVKDPQFVFEDGRLTSCSITRKTVNSSPIQSAWQFCKTSKF